MHTDKDITTVLLSDTDTLDELIAVFPESIILDIEFKIVATGRLIEETFGYTPLELNNNRLDIFSFGLEDIIRKKLEKGYFEERDFSLYSKERREILAGISGFYLGIFADVNGYIILRLVNPVDTKARRSYSLRADDFDRFVYNAAHSLRGPLATIKGLINLARISDKQNELEYALDQLGVYSEKLDDKLHKLILFAEPDMLQQQSLHLTSKHSLEQRLRSMVEEMKLDHPVQFDFRNQWTSMDSIHEAKLTSLLSSFIVFILSLEHSEAAQLRVELLPDKLSTDIIMEMNGFRFKEEQIFILKNNDYGYASLLKHPDLIKCYIAQRNISNMEGAISLKFVSEVDQIIVISIPPSTKGTQ